jgi:hypothetical protein
MADAKKLGLQLSLGGGVPAERFKFAQEAESIGYSSLWVAEVSGPDALVTLGALAVNTSKAELATGVIPMQIRTPGVNAMAFLTIQRIVRRPRHCGAWSIESGDRRAMARGVISTASHRDARMRDHHAATFRRG